MAQGTRAVASYRHSLTKKSRECLLLPAYASLMALFLTLFAFVEDRHASPSLKSVYSSTAQTYLVATRGIRLTAQLYWYVSGGPTCDALWCCVIGLLTWVSEGSWGLFER